MTTPLPPLHGPEERLRGLAFRRGEEAAYDGKLVAGARAVDVARDLKAGAKDVAHGQETAREAQRQQGFDADRRVAADRAAIRLATVRRLATEATYRRDIVREGVRQQGFAADRRAAVARAAGRLDALKRKGRAAGVAIEHHDHVRDRARFELQAAIAGAALQTVTSPDQAAECYAAQVLLRTTPWLTVRATLAQTPAGTQAK